jgi:hypothetical protein
MLERSRGVAKIGTFGSVAADISKVRERAQTACKCEGVAHPLAMPETGADRRGEDRVSVAGSNALIGRLDLGRS